MPSTIPQFDNKALEGNELFVSQYNGKNWNHTATQIKDFVKSEIAGTLNVAVPFNTTEQIPLVAYVTSPCVFVKYYATRGTKMSAGQLIVMAYTNLASTIIELGKGTYPADFEETGGYELTTSIDAGIINLNITTDNNDTENTSFNYIITAL